MREHDEEMGVTMKLAVQIMVLVIGCSVGAIAGFLAAQRSQSMPAATSKAEGDRFRIDDAILSDSAQATVGDGSGVRSGAKLRGRKMPKGGMDDS